MNLQKSKKMKNYAKNKNIFFMCTDKTTFKNCLIYYYYFFNIVNTCVMWFLVFLSTLYIHTYHGKCYCKLIQQNENSKTKVDYIKNRER